MKLGLETTVDLVMVAYLQTRVAAVIPATKCERHISTGAGVSVNPIQLNR
jgi:hypothetical protein